MPATPYTATRHPTMSATLHDLLETARAAGDAGADVLRAAADEGTFGPWEEKGPADFVTAVDRRSQDAVLDVIRGRHPDHRILAEEDDPRSADDRTSGTEGDPDGPLWVVDPLDGTTNFIHGHPAYAVSVAVIDGDGLAAAAVVAPATDERWWASRGRGAYLDGGKIGVSDIRDPDRALVATGFPFRAPGRIPEYLPQLEGILRATTGVRRCGSAALDLSFLASGRVDAFWELDLEAWDVMAGILLVREAGGRVTRVDGSEIDLAPGSVVGAGYHMFTDFLDLVRGTAP